MSVDYESHAIIGCRIEPKVVKVRSCKHPEKNSAFCPECGKAMWDEDTISPVDMKLPKGYVIVDTGTESDTFIVGPEKYHVKAEAGSARRLPAPEELDSIIAGMKKHGLYDEDTFGLWAVGYCSY